MASSRLAAGDAASLATAVETTWFSLSSLKTLLIPAVEHVPKTA